MSEEDPKSLTTIPHQDTSPADPRDLLAAALRIALDPNSDPARLREALAIGRELQMDHAKALFAADYACMKPELPVISKNGVVLNKSGKQQFKFARYDDLHEGIAPVLAKWGFATSFNFEEPEKGRLTCILELSHRAGHSKFYRWTLPASGENQYVTNLQNAAAARSFGKRCVLIDALDILTKDTDRDGTDVPPPERITEEQARTIEDMLAACEQREKGATARFHKWIKTEMQVEKIRSLFQGVQHDSVMVMLKRKMTGLGIK